MVKIPGGKAGSVSRLKKLAEKNAGGNTWIRSVKEGEDLVVRFLTEPDEWFAYREHFDPQAYFFPCIGKDEDCPGCHSDNEKVQRTSRRFLTNALLVEEGQVVPLKLPLDLANRLVARFERYGNTIMDRDYELHRMGSGLDTTYDVTPESPSEVDHTRFELIDLEEVLIESFNESFGDDDEEEETPPKRERRKAQPDEDEVPSEPSSDTDEDAGDGYLTEEQALAMSKADLKELADQLDVEIDGRWAKDKIVRTIFDAAT